MNTEQSAFYLTISNEPEYLEVRTWYVELCEYFAERTIPVEGHVVYQSIFDSYDIEGAREFLYEYYFGETGSYQLEDGANMRIEYFNLPFANPLSDDEDDYEMSEEEPNPENVVPVLSINFADIDTYELDDGAIMRPDYFGLPLAYAIEEEEEIIYE